MTNKKCTFTDYLKFRAELRGFDLVKIEDILRHSQERYFDTETQRHIVVGKHGDKWVTIRLVPDLSYCFQRQFEVP